MLGSAAMVYGLSSICSISSQIGTSLSVERTLSTSKAKYAWSNGMRPVLLVTSPGAAKAGATGEITNATATTAATARVSGECLRSFDCSGPAGGYEAFMFICALSKNGLDQT